VTDERDLLFYDGECGFCHGAARFVRKRDRSGLFNYAPLQGEEFQQAVSRDQRSRLPDSLVLFSRKKGLLTRSNAALYIFSRLPQPWPFYAGILRLVPRPLRDFGYDQFARFRRKLFPRPESCELEK
jgi:predicted DCC family thiol-disulfide oxidoreductase YuxK